MRIPMALSRIARGFVLGFAFFGATTALQQWWLTSELGPLRRVRTERQECAKGVSVPYQEEQQSRKLSRFLGFAGLAPTSTQLDVKRLYGAPETEESYPQQFTYLNGGIAIGFHDGTVDSIRLSNRFALLGGPGIDEPLAVFLGAPASAVLEEFGLPHQVVSGHFMYKFSGPGTAGNVSFQCYDFRKCICTEISVHWRVL